MDRYTIKNKDGYDLDANLYVQGECAVFNGAIERLGQYEDTGLMPGQIWEMDKLYREMYSEKCREVAELKKRLEQQEERCGLLLRLPCKVGDTVYKIIGETVPNHYYYIGEYVVQDISVKSIYYAGRWNSKDSDNLYFSREDAEKALAELEAEDDYRRI